MIVNGNNVVRQFPLPTEFRTKENWPPDIGRLYGEASLAYSAGAFTAAGMVARKVLMACACHEGDTDNKTFAQYVDYILTNLLPIPKAKSSIDAIRNIGNEANHKLEFLTQDAAKRAIQIVTYMLDALYTLPTA